jgi:N-acetylglucosaminyl-diphospho-decaprenol L-rhamnosyltransferase
MSFDGTIIIVNFNSGRYLADCLESIATHAPLARTIVVDNASSDGSEHAADRDQSRVDMVRNPANVGFARAVNQALARADSDLILLLNPDCRLLAGAIDLLQTELSGHPECAIVAPQILNDDGTPQGNVRGDPTMMTGLFGRTTLLTRWFPQSPLARRNVRMASADDRGQRSFEADWVSGACMLARRRSLAAVAGFDERYFLYWEDADLCRRLRAGGESVRCLPSAHVIHVAGQSSRSARDLSTRAFHESAYTYYATHVASSAAQRASAWLLLQLRLRWRLFRSVDQRV